jgi:glycosyltransferase involved in cell wall biosynthesis
LRALVVMPTYNEAKSLTRTVEELLSLVDGVDVLIVDDNSPDGTGLIADSLALENPRVRVLHRANKQGLGPAYLEGFKHAFDNAYETVVEMDADGSHRAEDLSKLLAEVQHADLVIGSRWIAGGSVQNWPIARLFLSRFGNLYARLMLGTTIRDMTSGFRAYRAEFLKKLIADPVSSQGYSFQVELAYRATKTGQVKELPITFVERTQGSSKMTIKIVFEALGKIQLWAIRRLYS